MTAKQKIDAAYFEAQADAANIPPAQRAQNIANAFNTGLAAQHEYFGFRTLRAQESMHLARQHMESQIPVGQILGFFNKVMTTALPSPDEFTQLKEAFEGLKSAHRQRADDTSDMQKKFQGFADTFNLLAAAEKKMRDKPAYMRPDRTSAKMVAQSIKTMPSEQEYLAKMAASIDAVTPYMDKLETYLDNREKLIAHLAQGMATGAPVVAPATARFRTKKP